jgi:multicomponent Na+:H+ antiporter subunit D
MSIAGLPPAAGFVGKLELFRAAGGDATLLALLFLGGALSFVYAFQVYQYEFWRGEMPDPPTSRAGRPQQALIASLALVVLALGLWPEPLLALSHDAATVLDGGAR